jgi:hypothetical protein
MPCDENEHVYKIRVDGTQIEEWYSLQQHKSEGFVERLWMKHLKEQGGFRSRFAETFAEHVTVDNICQTSSEHQAGRTVQQISPAEVAALEDDERQSP